MITDDTALQVTANFRRKIWQAAIGLRSTLDGGEKWECRLLRNGKVIKRAYRKVFPDAQGTFEATKEWPTWTCQGGKIDLVIVDPENDIAATLHVDAWGSEVVTVTANKKILSLK